MSNLSYSPLDPAADLTSGQKIKVADLDFYALLRRNGSDGTLFFNKRRAVLFDVEAMGALRHQLISTLGTEIAMGILLRFGYAQGYQDAETLENCFDWDSDADWLAAGPKLHNLEGIVHVETQHAEFDRDSGKFSMRGRWYGSYEAEEHLLRFGPSQHPVCWTLTGYASGYATRFFGKPALALETECIGKGDDHCTWEIRLADQWGSEADRYVNALRDIDLSDRLPSHNKKKAGKSFREPALAQAAQDATGTNPLAGAASNEAQAALSRRAVELETVFRVSAAAATTLNVDTLLQTVVNMTKDNFDLYHAHIYLFNPVGGTLNLTAGAGKIGRDMVKQGWSIPLDRTDSIVAQAGRNRSGVIANNVQSAPEFLPNPLLPDTQSELAVPMLIGNRLLGVLDVQSDQVGFFTEDNVRIQSTLAAQVAVALQNANLYQETQSTLKEIESLYNASRRINESIDLQEVVAAVAAGGSVPAIDRILLVYFEYNAINELDSVVVAATWSDGSKSPPPANTRYTQTMFPVFSLLQRSDPLFVNDVQHDERLDLTMLDTFYRLNIRSLAVLPLWAGRRQIGVLLLESAVAHQYTDRQMGPYISLASQVAVTVENRRLLEETRVALTEVEATQRRYTVQAWQSYKNRETSPGFQQVKEGVLPLNNELSPEIDWAINRKQTTVISSADTPSGTDTAKSSLIVPLKVRNEIIGILGLQETDQERTWTPEEIALVEAVAEQMALAAENLRLLDETQRAAWRDQIVSESTAKVWSSAEIEDVMKTAVTQLADKLRASEVVIRLGTDEQLLND